MLNQGLGRDIGSELISTNVNAFPRRPWNFHPNKRLENTDHPVRRHSERDGLLKIDLVSETYRHSQKHHPKPNLVSVDRSLGSSNFHIWVSEELKQR